MIVKVKNVVLARRIVLTSPALKCVILNEGPRCFNWNLQYNVHTSGVYRLNSYHAIDLIKNRLRQWNKNAFGLTSNVLYI